MVTTPGYRELVEAFESDRSGGDPTLMAATP
jgi:hypothetical protein